MPINKDKIINSVNNNIIGGGTMDKEEFIGQQ